MIDIKNVLRSIDQDPRLNDINATPSLVARLISSHSAVQLVAAVSKNDRKRHLLIAIREKLTPEKLESLPKWYGLSIEQEKLTILDIRTSWFLILKHTNESDKDIFEAVISNICNELLLLNDNEAMLPTLIKILDKWKYFFTLYSREGLSSTEQQGLYGELWFLRELIDYSRLTSLVKNWTGIEKTTHDFQIGKSAIEIKTSVSNKPYSAKINNENQLDDTNLANLYLAFLALHPMLEGGETLPDIISQIRRKIANDTEAKLKFEEKLFFSGYVENQSHLYKTGYALRDVIAFSVKAGFPRILNADVPDGIGDISYSIQISVCEPFKVNLEHVLQQVTSN
ncbi:PD-(D/E)XK motif protein [Ruminiclostridium cellobioparum]|uniref:PD-(D/E)XK motif protein n=1 Tax=Ruminiclostridium cellobioparum subsp. termitidis CT1112 TaxID=1195236 RepID=S0FJY4_RUMCE|nr:PD-(D/E)XK motif protein [Ruminiclostridium cellobioparum]EMS70621.1 hypothetical protein CTER_3614 [Ruminiclostridium cellobioparum subsp. termitidis CT1112]